MAKIGDFVIGLFDPTVENSTLKYDERLCLIIEGTGIGSDWFRLLFCNDGNLIHEDLPEDRVKSVGFNFEQLTDEWDTQGSLQHLAELRKERQREFRK